MAQSVSPGNRSGKRSIWLCAEFSQDFFGFVAVNEFHAFETIARICFFLGLEICFLLGLFADIARWAVGKLPFLNNLDQVVGMHLRQPTVELHLFLEVVVEDDPAIDFLLPDPRNHLGRRFTLLLEKCAKLVAVHVVDKCHYSGC